MQLIFKYDLDRLSSYSVNPENKIKVIDEPAYTLLCFPEVGYFNYSFLKQGEVFTKQQLQEVSSFYLDNNIGRHKILVEASCIENNALLAGNNHYQRISTIAKTTLPLEDNFQPPSTEDLHFIKADNSNIKHFTELYIRSFEAERKMNAGVYKNFETLLGIPHLDLFLLQQNETYVGVNILYQQENECLLAGGAILPEYRNKGFHKQGLSFRIRQSLMNANVKNIVAWAYQPSISLKNMLTLNMHVQEEFNVYEYCK